MRDLGETHEKKVAVVYTRVDECGYKVGKDGIRVTDTEYLSIIMHLSISTQPDIHA